MAAATNQIYMWDRQSGGTALVTHQPGTNQPGSASSWIRGFSPDGQWLVFCASSTNLVSGADSGQYQLYRYHLATGTNQWLTANRLGRAGAWSANPALSADGHWLAFASEDSNLVDNDLNSASDVFIKNLSDGQVELISERHPALAPQTSERASALNNHSLSGDGMDDDWELTYFGDLSRDGKGDADGDGLSDLNEFKAGTSPVGSSSFPRAMTVSPLNGGATTVIWNSVSGRVYRVQYKNSLRDPAWADLAGEVVAGDRTASKTDDTATGLNQRFYRILLVSQP